MLTDRERRVLEARRLAEDPPSLEAFGREMSISNERIRQIEQRKDGRYNVSRPNADRASAVTDTQADGIARAREMDPNATIHVERVRDVGPGRDKWRKI